MDEYDTQGQLTGEIQGNILRGYVFHHACFAFFEIMSAEDGRDWLAGLPITNGEAWASAPAIASNVAFTHAGLAKLGVHADTLSQFSPAFQAGMQARRSELGDPDDLGAWDALFRDDVDRIHVLLSLYGDDSTALGTRLDEIKDHAGVALLGVQPGRWLEGREHFGFRDGIGQPIHNDGSDGWVSPEGVPIREFLLFDSNWNGGAGSAKGLQLGRLGTYLVYRKLQQDVPSFRAFVKGWDLAPDLAAAKVVGRWPNGTPLTRKPDAPSSVVTEQNDDAFDYIDTDDKEGYKCPLGAHISRTNPRRRLAAGTNDRRILRRGIPYGEPLQQSWGSSFGGPVPQDDGVERGLVFLCFNASIENQFEILQGSWINETTFLGQDGGEPLANTLPPAQLGNFRSGPDATPRALQSFVTLKGGEYFFVPCIEALTALAAGEFGAP